MFLMKSLTTKSFRASQFTGRHQLLQKTRPLTSLNSSSRALSYGLLRFSNDRPKKVQATKPDLIRLSPPLFSNQRKKPREGSEHNKANEPSNREVILNFMPGLYNTGELGTTVTRGQRPKFLIY